MAVESHWSMGLGATIWLLLSAAQLRRIEIGGPFARIRLGLGALFGSVSVLLMFGAVSFYNPLSTTSSSLILGPRILNTLIPAYLLPATALMASVWWLKSLSKPVRHTAFGAALVLLGTWVGLTIRHFWRGAEHMALPGIDQAELYSYTVVLLLIGAGLFFQSLRMQNDRLRKAGLIFIGLAVAKVFIWDIRDLGGLVRVFSLLLLGVSLSGLAWLNRWAAMRSESEVPKKDEPDESS